MASAIKPVSLTIPDSKKDKDWHKDYALYLLRVSDFDLSRITRITYAMNYVNGKIDPQADHNHFIQSDVGLERPYDFINFNEIRGIVDQLVGEMDVRGEDLHVKALSKHALARKNEGIIGMETDFRLLDLYVDEQERFGVPTLRDDMPFSKDDLEEKKKNYKEEGEDIYTLLLREYLSRIKWSGKMEQAYENCIVGGMTACYHRMFKNGPYTEVMDPRKVVFDTNMKDQWGEDAEFVGYVEYRSFSWIRENYDIDDKKLEELKQNSSKRTMNIGIGSNNAINAYRRYRGDEEETLVVHLFWKDVKKKKGFKYDSHNGTTHFKIHGAEIDPEEAKKGIDTPSKRKKASEVTDIDVEIVRHCCLAGGEMVLESGEWNNMVRTADDWQKTGFPIQIYLPRWSYGYNVSLVDQLIPLQKLKDRALYKLQQSMIKDRGKFIVSDVAQRPNNHDMESQMYFAELFGVYEINSRREGIPANYNQFQQVDMTLSVSADMYMKIAEMCHMEIERISGISSARAGVIDTPSQAVGIAEISKAQSQVRTLRFFHGFNIFMENIFTYALGLQKIAYTSQPEKYAHIVGESGIRFLKENIDFNLDDYGVEVSANKVSDEDKAIIREMIPVAVQNLQMDAFDGLEILLEDDPREAMKEIRKRVESNRRKQEQMQQIQQQQQNQLQQGQIQQKQEQANIDLQKEQMKGDTTIQKQLLNNRNARKIAEMNNRMKLRIEKIKDRKKVPA